MPTPTENLQAAYASLCQQLAEISTNPQPSYSEKGRSVSWKEHHDGILNRIKELIKIPGVAPDQLPSFLMEEYL